MTSPRGVFPRGFFPNNLGPSPKFRGKARYLRIKRIPKPNGKIRQILVPSGKLKEAQHSALEYLTSKIAGRYPIDLLTCQTAYKRGASAYKNAKRHEDYEVSIKFDLKSCFDSIPQNSRMSKVVINRFGRKPDGKPPSATKALSRRYRPKNGYKQVAVSVEEALVRERIPKDIAEWISDVSTFRGFLYQGSPLSPLLCNIVTKQTLCRRMLKLATVYHLPIFEVRSAGIPPWLFVVSTNLDRDSKIYVWNLASHNNTELAGVAHQVSLARGHWVMGRRGGTVVVEDMVPQPGEPTKKMLLRYAQQAWKHRKTGMVKKILGVLSNHPDLRPMPGSPDDLKVRHHPLGKTIFTLYADDGVFSSNNRKLPLVRFILKNVIRDSGFRPNAAKGIRVMKGCRRTITGFEVSPPPKGCPPGDSGTRLSWPERDKRYRRKLHYMSTGKLPINEETVQSFAGSLEYLRAPNPRAWKKHAKKFYDIVVASTSDSDVLKLVSRFKEL